MWGIETEYEQPQPHRPAPLPQWETVMEDQQLEGSATPVGDFGLGLGIFVVLVAIGQAVATCGMGLPLAVLAIWWVHKKGL